MIHLIIGTMFAGKSTQLLKYLRRSKIANKTVCLLVPELDNRGYLTHNDEMLYEGIDLFYYPTSSQPAVDILDKLLTYDIIGIDEYQFFPMQHWQTGIFPFLLAVQQNHRSCYLAGLSGTFHLHPFDIISATLPLANNIQLEDAICKKCGETAYYTYRFDAPKITGINSDNIGSDDKYMPLCWRCWQSYFRGNMLEEHLC